jgi:hypothetical protein
MTDEPKKLPALALDNFKEITVYTRTKGDAGPHKGESEQLSAKINPDVTAEGDGLIILCKEYGIPFSRRADMVRTGYYLLVERLKTHFANDNPTDFFVAERRLLELEAQMRHRRALENVLVGVVEEIGHKLIDFGQIPDMLVDIAGVLGQHVMVIENIRATSPGWYLKWTRAFITNDTILRALRLLEQDERYQDTKFVIVLQQWVMLHKGGLRATATIVS